MATAAIACRTVLDVSTLPPPNSWTNAAALSVNGLALVAPCGGIVAASRNFPNPWSLARYC
jgi:hypothetical protein